MVVDGRIGIIGGVNLDRVYENPCDTGLKPGETEAPCWHDTSIRIEGPAVGAMQRLFLETWQREGGPALPPRDWFPRLDARARRASASSAARRGRSGRATT